MKIYYGCAVASCVRALRLFVFLFCFFFVFNFVSHSHSLTLFVPSDGFWGFSVFICVCVFKSASDGFDAQLLPYLGSDAFTREAICMSYLLKQFQMHTCAFSLFCTKQVRENSRNKNERNKQERSVHIWHLAYHQNITNCNSSNKTTEDCMQFSKINYMQM